MPAALVYPLAALAEIAGCFAVWAWWRGASILWLLPGLVSLGLFGWLLAQVEAGFAGRACAAYGGVYIAASLLWMVVLGRKTAREKIASFLTTIARREAVLRRARAVNGMRFDLPISRDAMADYLGLTIETVSRQISSLKRDNVIVLESKRTAVVPDYARLAAEAGDDSDGGVLC